MPLPTLPDDIYKLIIEEFIAFHFGLVNSLKKSFKLLRINRRWRQLALPYVYQTAFITYENEDKTSEPSLFSNLELIQSANCIQFVRDLRISIYYLTSPAAGLTQVAAVLSKLPCDNQVQSLCFLLTHGVSDFSNQIFEDEQLAQAAKDIAMVFPRITRLKFDGSFTTDATKKISSYITKQYAHQLERLESEYAIGNENKFPALKYASINVFGENHFEIPQMSADHLEYLELFNLPLNCSWDSFKSSDGDIEFSRLAKLFISYTSFPDESQQYVFSDYRLIFPKLDTFSINGVITKHSVLSQMVFPPQMDKLFINCHGNMFQNLKNTRLPSTKLLVLSTSLEHDDNPRTVSYMNQLVSNAAGTESVHLWINKSTCTVSVGDITCNAITKLRIEVPIDIETVLSLIDTLSNLEIMDITCLTGDHTQYVDLSKADKQPLVPFNTKLQWLTVNFDHGMELGQNIVEVAIYILLKLPMLEKVWFERIGSELEDKLKPFTELYPHLKTIFLN